MPPAPADQTPLAPRTPPSVEYPPASAAARDELLKFIRKTPIAFGTWREFKALYKEVEADSNADPQLLGALLARIDSASLSPPRANPTVTFGSGTLTGSISFTDAVVRDGKAYMVGSYSYRDGEQIRVYDLDTPDPLKPELVGEKKAKDAVLITLCGNFACLYGNQYSANSPVRVMDISDPANIVERGSLKVGTVVGAASAYPYFLAAINSERGKAFCGLRIVSIADPDNPQIVSELAIPNVVSVMADPEGAFAIVATGSVGFSWNSLPKPGGIRIVSLKDPADPRIIGSLDLGSTSFAGADIASHYVFLGAAYHSRSVIGGVQIVDITQPDKPRKAGFWPTPNGGSVQYVMVQDNTLYAVTNYGVVHIVDVSSPEIPRALAEIHAPYTARLAVKGSTLYLSPQWGGVSAWNIADPRKPVRIGMPPSAATMGYMKRRARRTLRELAQSDTGRYVETAYRLLMEPGRHKAEVDPASQWVAMDILYGGGDYYQQTQHGRGGYKSKNGTARRLYRRRVEARFAEAWDARPDLAIELLKKNTVAWQAQEMAVGVLLRTRTPLPALSDSAIEHLVSCPSPVLQAVGVRQASQMLKGGKRLKPEAAAHSFILSPPKLRGGMRTAILSLAQDSEWASGMAARLFALLPQHLSEGHFTRRGMAAALLLASGFADRARGSQVFDIVVPLLQSGNDVLIRLAVAGARVVKEIDLMNWLGKVSDLEEATREPVICGLEEAVKDVVMNAVRATQMVVSNLKPAICQSGWRLLAASASPESLFAALWTALLEQTEETPALRAAMNSPHALTLLTRSGITSEQIAEKLTTRPFLVALLSSETFTRISQSVPASVTLQLIAAAPDALWTHLRVGWLRNLREGVGLTELWTSVPAALENDVDDRIAARVVGDAEVMATFQDIEPDAAETLLALREPLLDSALAQWVSRHETLFPADSDLLRQAATHVLPEVRGWGLARVDTVGMRLPFALRLLESEVPPSVVVGKNFFERVPHGDSRELTDALALCDSPQRSVRAFGQDYVRVRWNTIPRADLYRALFENPAPEMQAFVAMLLENEPRDIVATEESAQFDRDVLRTRDRARRAKEAVKARQTETPSLDSDTLLSLARGAGTPRDAEWALSQLARRVIAGEKIDGFAVEGIAGG